MRNYLKKLKNAADISATVTSIGAQSAIKSAQNVSGFISLNAKKIYDKATETGRIDPNMVKKISISATENKVASWINTQLEIQNNIRINNGTEKLYEEWSKLLNSYILFAFYGRLLIIENIRQKIFNHINNQNADEKKVNLIAFLYVQLESAKDEIQFNMDNIFPDLNRKDQKWLSEVVFPISNKQQQLTSLLGNTLRSINPFNSLFNRINDVVSCSSVIKKTLDIDSSSTISITSSLIDTNSLIPKYLQTQLDKIIYKAIPGLYSCKDKKEALSIFDKCSDKYNVLKSLIPIDLKDKKENNKIAIANIIKRDYNYLGNKKFESADLRKALLGRIVNLEALNLFTTIDHPYINRLSYTDILREINYY